MLLESGSWLRRRRSHRKSCLIHQMKKNWITIPHGPAALGRTHPGGNSKFTCTQRNISTGHSPSGQEDITDWPPVTGYRSNGHYTRLFKSVNHQSPSIQPPVIGLRKSQHRGKSPVIRLYINLHLVRLICHGHGVH